jgi:hypothetical protein
VAVNNRWLKLAGTLSPGAELLAAWDLAVMLRPCGLAQHHGPAVKPHDGHVQPCLEGLMFLDDYACLRWCH